MCAIATDEQAPRRRCFPLFHVATMTAVNRTTKKLYTFLIE